MGVILQSVSSPKLTQGKYFADRSGDRCRLLVLSFFPAKANMEGQIHATKHRCWKMQDLSSVVVYTFYILQSLNESYIYMNHLRQTRLPRWARAFSFNCESIVGLFDSYKTLQNTGLFIDLNRFEEGEKPRHRNGLSVNDWGQLYRQFTVELYLHFNQLYVRYNSHY